MTSLQTSKSRPLHFDLRLAVSACFLFHGIVALANASVYQSEWSNWVQSMFPEPYKFKGAFFVLTSAAFLDFMTAGLILIPEIPSVAMTWAMFWSMATATSRLFFLGGFEPPYWLNVLVPFTEFLRRFPNWMLPLLVWQMASPDSKFLFVKTCFLNLRIKSFLSIGALAFSLAVATRLSVNLIDPMFDMELIKQGMPREFFSFALAIAWLAVVSSLYLYASIAKSKAQVRFLMILAAGFVLLNVGLTEWTEYFYHNRLSGVWFSLVRFGEHAPIWYVALFLTYHSITMNLAKLQKRA